MKNDRKNTIATKDEKIRNTDNIADKENLNNECNVNNDINKLELKEPKKMGKVKKILTGFTIIALCFSIMPYMVVKVNATPVLREFVLEHMNISEIKSKVETVQRNFFDGQNDNIKTLFENFFREPKWSYSYNKANKTDNVIFEGICLVDGKDSNVKIIITVSDTHLAITDMYINNKQQNIATQNAMYNAIINNKEFKTEKEKVVTKKSTNNNINQNEDKIVKNDNQLDSNAIKEQNLKENLSEYNYNEANNNYQGSNTKIIGGKISNPNHLSLVTENNKDELISIARTSILSSGESLDAILNHKLTGVSYNLKSTNNDTPFFYIEVGGWDKNSSYGKCHVFNIEYDLGKSIFIIDSVEERDYDYDSGKITNTKVLNVSEIEMFLK